MNNSLDQLASSETAIGPPGATALRLVDVTVGDGVLVIVRRSKTNQDGETNDVRFVKDGVSRAMPTVWSRCRRI